MKRALLTLSLLFLQIFLKAQTLQKLPVSPCKSIRGLSVVDDRVAWASGAGGYVGITKDGGSSWQWQQVPGFEMLDFRDVEGFSAGRAVIMSSGTPAVIMTTDDGGATWQTRYRSDDKAVFLDEMDFAGADNGTILGDPVDGKFLLMNTADGGKTWHKISHAPAAAADEACFAASGTGIRYTDQKNVAFVTGGSTARLFVQNGEKWSAKTAPVAHGKPSQGLFSLAVAAGGKWLLVGGDYVNDRLSALTGVLAEKADEASPDFHFIDLAGFRSCVEWTGKRSALAVGTSGVDFSRDGKKWKNISKEGYHVCRKAKNGTLVLLAGGKGQMAKLSAN